MMKNQSRPYGATRSATSSVRVLVSQREGTRSSARHHRKVRPYGFAGLAGCVVQSVAQQTGTLVGVYHGLQAGLEDDPETPWVTVCEVHASLVTHPTLALARSHAADPKGWCEECARPVTDGT